MPSARKAFRARTILAQASTIYLPGAKKRSDAFYASRIPKELSADAKLVMRQAFAGMMWNKQFYHYDVRTWLDGDPAGPPPPKERLQGRNHDWTDLYNDDVISMPDNWEYPWYAAWDLAFHTIPIALIDPDFAKDQLILLLREWYMHPNGQLPAYEWAFGDVNPPVHGGRPFEFTKSKGACAEWRIADSWRKVFHKLLLNFTWWVNRKDPEGMNIFEGGFLGLDNIGVFDRSAPLPTGGHLEQSDATSWMGMYCLNMLAIALESRGEGGSGVAEDVASKFFEHFVHIAHAMNDMGTDGRSLWDEEDGFYYERTATAERGRTFPENPFDGRADPAICGGNAGAGDRRLPARLQAADAVVHRQPSGYAGTHRDDAAFGARRAPVALAGEPGTVEACVGAYAG